MPLVEMLCKDLETKEILVKCYNADVYTAITSAEMSNLEVLSFNTPLIKPKISLLELQYFCDYLLPIIGKDLLKKCIKYANEIHTISYGQRRLIFKYLEFMEG